MIQLQKYYILHIQCCYKKTVDDFRSLYKGYHYGGSHQVVLFCLIFQFLADEQGFILRKAHCDVNLEVIQGFMDRQLRKRQICVSSREIYSLL